MAPSGGPLKQPTLGRILLESRAVLELGAFAASAPALQLAPKGDGHPVLVLPGLAATDESTRPLRWFLRNRGYHTHGWRLGRNTGPTERVRAGLRDRVRSLVQEHGRRISLVGWSLGGIYAREIARLAPDAVRQVITLGSPFRFLDESIRSDVPLRDTPGDPDHSSRLRHDVGADAGRALQVPTTAVYTRSDGVVPWQLCVERPGPRRESVEVHGSHIGLGHNPSVLLVVANRLAQPEGTWRPFTPPAHLAALLPARRPTPPPEPPALPGPRARVAVGRSRGETMIGSSSCRARSVLVALAAALVAGLATVAPVPAPVAQAAPARSRAPELGPLVAGTSSYVDGTFVWTDYVLDDRGPNLEEVGLLGPPRCPVAGQPDCSGGDADYPDFAAPGGTADLVQLQLGRDDGRLSVRAVLGSLVDPDVPVLGVAFDTDADPSTGAAEVPGGRWPAVDPLGVDLLVVVSSAGTELWRAEGGTWARQDVDDDDVSARVDPAANTLDARVARRLLPAMEGRWRAFGLVGVQDASGGSWVDGSQEIFDLAFVGDEPFVLWQDARQGDVLAGPRAPTHDGLSSQAAAAVLDWGVVRSGRTRLADTESPGFHTYLYRSALELPEGVTSPNPEVSTQHEYLGRYQPYLVHIPEERPAGNPLTVWLHGANNNHLQSIFEAGFYVGTARAGSEDWFLVEMFQPDALVEVSLPPTIQIYVLGRGETLGYQGISEIDVLEATDDAVERLDIDRDRITLSGASMGGVGSYRLGVLHPDRWAATIPVIGTGVEYRDLFVNLGNVPVRQMNGAEDGGELGPPSEQDAVTLDELGYDHHYWLGLDRGHEVPGYYACVFETALEAKRQRNPHEVVYRIDPATFQVDPSRDVDLRYDGAYWVSGMVVRDDAPGTVRAVSDARPARQVTLERTSATRDNRTSGQDLCGPNPRFAPGWSPAHPEGETWRERALTRVPGPREDEVNRVTVSLENLAAVTLDLDRADVRKRRPATIEVVSDGAAQVTLTGLRKGAAIRLGGTPVGAVDRHGVVTLAVPSGVSTVTVVP